MTVLKLPSKASIYKDIKACGVSKAVLTRVLPDWWDDDLLSSNSGFAEFTNYVKQRLGLQVKVDTQGRVSFKATVTSVQFKKRTSTDIKRLSDAMFISKAAGKTALRIILQNGLSQNLNSLQQALNSAGLLSLEKVLRIVWEHNIPVIYANNYGRAMSRPAGVVMHDAGLYAIVLSHKHASPSTQLFVLLHEVGHILCGHLEGSSGLITDASFAEFGESLRVEQDEQEEDADKYALNLLRNGVDVESMIRAHSVLERPAELALMAKKLNKERKVDAGHYVLTYGRLTNDWPLTHQALKFLEQKNAQEIIFKVMDEVLDLLDVEREDAEYLAYVQGK